MAEETTPPVETPPTEPVAYDWRTDIHPDVKDDKVWESVSDIKTLTKAYADATRYNVGALKLPAQDAPPEEWEKVWDKLGRPSAPEGYQNTHEGADADPEFAAQMKGVCHAAGITAAQWKVLATGYRRIEEGKLGTESQKVATVTAALKEEYGAAFEKNLGLVQRVVKKMGGDEAWAELSSNHALGSSPLVIKMLVNAAKALAEQKVISSEIETGVTTDDAKNKLNELTVSKAYLDPKDPQHENVVKQVTRLFEQVYN